MILSECSHLLFYKHIINASVEYTIIQFQYIPTYMYVYTNTMHACQMKYYVAKWKTKKLKWNNTDNHHLNHPFHFFLHLRLWRFPKSEYSNHMETIKKRKVFPFCFIFVTISCYAIFFRFGFSLPDLNIEWK